MCMGTYRIGDESSLSRRYIFIPSLCLMDPQFSVEDIFEMMDVDMPNMLFQLSQPSGYEDWNVYLPLTREFLADGDRRSVKLALLAEGKPKPMEEKEESKTTKESNTEVHMGLRNPVKEVKEEADKTASRQLQHYHGVLRENCKRLLLITGLACKKAGAGFRITESWNPEAREDAVAGWITDDNKANVLALGMSSSCKPLNCLISI